jgi:hypothetical protein
MGVGRMAQKKSYESCESTPMILEHCYQDMQWKGVEIVEGLIGSREYRDMPASWGCDSDVPVSI